MKELENVMSQLEKETKKKEQAENKIKLLRQKKSQLKRKGIFRALRLKEVSKYT